MTRLALSRTSLKLLAWFLAVYLLIATGTIVSIATARSIRESVDSFDQVVLPGTLLLARTATVVHSTVDDSHTLPTRNIRPTMSPEAQAIVRQKNYDNVLADWTEMQGYIDALSALNLAPSERAVVSELQAAFDDFRAIDGRMIPHMLAGSDEEVGIGRAIGQGELTPAFERLDEIIARLLKLEEEGAHAGAQHAVQAEDSAKQTLGVVLAIGLLLVLSIGLYVGYSISKQIAERRRVEAALFESERLSRQVIETAQEGVWIGNAGLETVFANATLGELLGLQRESLLGQRLDHLIEDAAARSEALALATRDQPARFDVQFRRPDGQERWALVSTSPLFDPSGARTGLVAMVTDITDRKLSEEALRVRDRAMTASSTPLAISDVRLPKHPLVYVNPAFERVTGYSAEEAIGQTLTFLAGPASNPLARDEIVAALQEQREAIVASVSYRKDGTTFPTELSLAPVRGTDGNITHYVWLVTDLTERKQAEAQAQTLARSEKLRAVGTMASGIAHDLNQSLMLIASYGELARQALEPEQVNRDELREMFTVIYQAAMDGGQTLKRLLRFARAPIEETGTPLDLTLLAREVAQLTAPRWRDAAQAEGRPIKLEVQTSGHPIVLGAPAPLRDAITNLVLNAVDALPSGGNIWVRVHQDDQRAVLEVADDGTGMSPEIKSRVFEPFFSTKGDKGTGLGLATLFGLVGQLGGEVSVDSQLGHGTTFRLIFPPAPSAQPAPLPVAAPRATEPERTQRQMRILAVDDEPALTKAVLRLLRPRGHVVKMASSGEEALEKLARESFDVVLSDIGMGEGMNGWELAEHVRASWPDVTFVLATGWGAAIDPEEARQKGIRAVLAKPYSLEDLEHVLAA